ncbi:uncharacterized protein LOC8270924 [Ricinus communis]|uniref:uncharacterized protein LOC8270924 n=1 Tax=Ricinus communis TaxID=3988 RepID=UPI00201AD9CB|nr:uncharacterized protein LOC8270924 [Ricinus communis]
MVATIVGSLIYTKARRVMADVFPPSLRKLWKDWELRALVLLSLILQIILIFLGNRRKYSSKTWLRIVLWCTYLTADWVATVALGVLSNNLGDVLHSDDGKSVALDADTELTAFWAPFLLLHLGGPDTVTAYAMEDNELWLRHFLGLGVQTGVALYIFILAWTGSHLSILTIPMIFAGLIKYGERTLVLRSASNEQFRDCMLSKPDLGPNYPKFMQEYNLKEFEGYRVEAEEMLEVEVQVDDSIRGGSGPDAPQLLNAYNSFQIFKRLFVDLILSFQDKENSQILFKNMSFIDAFKVVEIELGFMFDVLYTKASVIYSVKGCILRCISLSFTCSVLVLFTIFVADKVKFNNVDLILTFLLLAVAIFLEIYAVLLLLSSDWTDIYMSKYAYSAVRKTINFLQLPKHMRWSNALAQYNLLSVSLNTKPAICHGIQRLFCIDKLMEKYRYRNFKQVSPDLKSLIFDHLLKKLDILENEKVENDNERASRDQMLRAQSLVLVSFGHPELKWSTDEMDFDQSILIWHIATYLCYRKDHEEISDPILASRRMSKRLSKYMLYLLIMCPFMLPMGIGNIRYRDTCAEVTKYLQERKSILGDSDVRKNYCIFGLECYRKMKIKLQKREACEMLLQVNTAVLPKKVKGDRSKSVLFDACRLASQLEDIADKEIKWEMVCKSWVERLTYAASQCSGTYHAQQLRRGGELLTHVWLLMSHLGLTDQFQISQGHARAKLVAK